MTKKQFIADLTAAYKVWDRDRIRTIVRENQWDRSKWLSEETGKKKRPLHALIQKIAYDPRFIEELKSRKSNLLEDLERWRKK